MLISEIEIAEKKQNEDAIRNGLIPDKKKFENKLLVQEVEFFMGKRTAVEADLQKLEIERENLEKDPSLISDLRGIKCEINGLKLTIGFFNNKIAVALHDLKVRKEKHGKNLMLFTPVKLTIDSWGEFLRKEGLEGMSKKKLEDSNQQ